MRQEEIEVKQYLALKKWDARKEGDTYRVKQCPYCQKSDWNFYISAETGQFSCKKASCAKVGNLISLKRDLGDLSKKPPQEDASKYIPADDVETWHNRLLKKKTALDYLESRCIGIEAVKHFRLGYRLLEVGDETYPYLVIPHLENGVCKNIKLRILAEDGTYPKELKWRREEGFKSVLFNSDVLREPNTEIIVAEAELDAISLWCAGFKNVVGLTCGADTFKPEWYDALQDKQVILCLDSDVAGFSGAQKIARRLGFDRTTYVTLPLKDANSVLVEMGAQEISEAIERREKFDVSGVAGIDTAIQRRMDNLHVEKTGLFSPWPSLNRMLGRGLQDGHLFVLSARYKVGKSTLALQWQTFLSAQNIPTLMVSLEMETDDLVDKIVQSVRCKDDQNISPIDYTLTRQFLQDKPFYFLENSSGLLSNQDKMFELMEDAVRRYGIKFLVFDHLHFLARSLTNINTEIGQIMRRFKSFARAHHLVVVLIAQPRKLNGQRPTADDLKDSVSIATDADWIVLLHRQEVASEDEADFDTDTGESAPVGTLSPITEVIFAAARFRGGGMTKLYYEGETSTFFELDGNQPNRACFHTAK